MISTSRPPMDNAQPRLGSAYDVVVIGGGPAGATTAALLAEHGHSVLVLERSAFPRFHVGESLIPETYHTLHRLGLIDRLKASEFPRKYSVQFVNEDGMESRPFYFDEYNPHESSVTWQVERGPFDQLLLDRARELGASIRTDAQVRDVEFQDGRAVGVKLRTSDSEGDIRIGARVVVDATGQSAFLASRLGLKERDERLTKGTVWSYFKGAKRDTGRDEGATLIMQTAEKKSWFWYIPLANDIVSVGCTGSLRYLFDDSRPSAKQIFERELMRCPAMQSRLAEGWRVQPFLTTRDFSYRTRSGCGPGWVLVGDAFGFIDPVYSSGVFLALKSGEMASDCISEALREDDLSAERLGEWQPVYRQGVDLFRRLVYAFYTPDFSFGRFFRDHPQFRSNMTDILIGDVFKPGVGDMFDVMGEIIPPEDAALAGE